MWVAEEKQELDAPGEVFPKGTANCWGRMCDSATFHLNYCMLLLPPLQQYGSKWKRCRKRLQGFSVGWRTPLLRGDSKSSVCSTQHRETVGDLALYRSKKWTPDKTKPLPCLKEGKILAQGQIVCHLILDADIWAWNLWGDLCPWKREMPEMLFDDRNGRKMPRYY